MKVLLTGAAGFIGSCYLWKLNTLGIEDVIVVDTSLVGASCPNLQNKKFSEYLTRDALPPLLEEKKLQDVDVVVHLGACADTTERNEDFLRTNNTEYSQILAKWALAHNKPFHYASSAAVYGDGSQGYADEDNRVNQYKPLNLYGESKRKFDQWLISKGLSNKVVGFRYFNVFGPNEYHKGDMRSMISKAYDQIKESGQVKLFEASRPGDENGSETRDFVYVKDVCDAMAFFLENPGKGGIFNIGTGKARSFKDLVTAVFSALNKPGNIKWVPMPEKLKGQYQYFTQADLTNLKKIGYTKDFSPLEDAVSDYVKNHLIKENPYL